jgi:nicotinate-nucleotide adenylyltransferase
MATALFFGSFNPIHNGHLAIALFLKQKALFDRIWLVVSPNNPLKEKGGLANEKHRLNMVKRAIEDFPFLHACDVEFSLPTPSYTIETLNYLKKQYPNDNFSLILGADNMTNFYQWKDYEDILNNYKIYVYPRSENMPAPVQHHNIIYMNDAPLLPVSATEIRSLLQQHKTVTEYLPVSVVQYINDNQLFL